MLGFLLALWISNIHAQHSITVDITEIGELKGEIEMCLYDTEQHFMNDPVKCTFIEVKEAKITHTFPDLPKGKYAVVIYQDLNGNRDLDTNWMRIPKEPYGFSNNPSTSFGPPSFEKASFEVLQDHKIEVRLE